jgi:HlyD family secretion protein
VVLVGSQVSGKIAKLFADFNSVVKQGQPLAQIDPQPFKARVSQARAAVNSARGNLAKAKNMAAQRKRERDRIAALRQEAFVSQADLDLAETNLRDAEAQVEVTQAQLDQAQATLSSAELDLGYTTIYSPVNGIVVSRNVDVGQTVAASFQTPTLFVIAQDLTQMQVNANVSESDIGGVVEGKPANFRVDAYPKQFFEGVVTQVRNAPISIQNVVTYDVVIAVDNPELKLKPGMTANVTIVTEEVGAKRAHILLQFLIEAIIMTAIGGMLGVGTGIGIARLLTAMIGWPTIINTDAVIAAFLFSLVVGLFFGLYPANKASKLNPIEALRYERKKSATGSSSTTTMTTVSANVR